jgi:formate hydrogenlyase transcriptional activator
VEGVESETGDPFFYSLVNHLASALQCEYALVSELLPGRLRFRTRAVWGRGDFMDNFEIPLAGTPCEGVLNGKFCHHPEKICELFPDDATLREWRVESYSGVPLLDSSGAVVGHLAILSEKPMWDGPRGVAIMRIFAARARAEIERLWTEKALQVSEERLARVLDSAMDAIVTFDSGRRVVLFNQSAENVFRCPAAEAIGNPVDRFLCDRLRELIQEAISQPGDLKPRPFLWTPGGLSARRADGDEFAIEATISEVDTQSGRLFTLILRDIGQRLRAEEGLRQLNLQKDYLLEEIKQEHNFEEIVGQSRLLAEVIEKLKLVAGTDSTVLILGETGTGKELIARAVHSHSARSDQPLVKVNCAGLPTGLIESELFGHEKGAFTGATERRIGRFELAHGGTIFLDEIGEVSAEVQAKLLRVLQEHEFERLGGSATIKVNVRVIAATNRELERAVSQGTFRPDLYYRLNVFPLILPPLRERREDIAPLVHYFVHRFSSKIGRKIERVRRETMNRLINYGWPGNIRELENVIERAVILSPGTDLEVPPGVVPEPTRARPSHLQAAGYAPQEKLPAASPNPDTLEDTVRERILEVLRQTKWRIEGSAGAAKLLNVKPNTLRSRMKKLGIYRNSASAS